MTGPIAIDAAEIGLYVADEFVTYTGYQYTLGLREGGHTRVDLWDSRKDSWRWKLMLEGLTRVDSQQTGKWGWCYVTAAIAGPDGSLYGTFRPFPILPTPWVYPNVLVWPDAWCGPVVLTIRPLGPLPTPVDPAKSIATAGDPWNPTTP